MIRCDKHRKDFIGGCMWCGRRLCELCIVKRDRSKLYCDKCVGMLSGIRRDHLPRVGSQPLPASGRRFLVRDGYLVKEDAGNGCF